MTTSAPTTTQCRARVHDGTLPPNTSQVRRCRNTAVAGEKFCPVHARSTR